MHKPLTLLAVTVAMIAAGCGSTQAKTEPSAKAQIQAAQRAYLAALKGDNVGDACRLTADHADCLKRFATARALGIKPSDMPNGNEEQLIKTIRLTIKGDHARSARGNEFVRRDGKWLMVLTN